MKVHKICFKINPCHFFDPGPPPITLMALQFPILEQNFKAHFLKIHLNGKNSIPDHCLDLKITSELEKNMFHISMGADFRFSSFFTK